MTDRTRTILGVLGIAGAIAMDKLDNFPLGNLAALISIGLMWPLFFGERATPRVSKRAELVVMVVALSLGIMAICIWLTLQPLWPLLVVAFVMTFGVRAFVLSANAANALLPAPAPRSDDYPEL
jgi:hypothetical protein